MTSLSSSWLHTTTSITENISLNKKPCSLTSVSSGETWCPASCRLKAAAGQCVKRYRVSVKFKGGKGMCRAQSGCLCFTLNHSFCSVLSSLFPKYTVLSYGIMMKQAEPEVVRWSEEANLTLTEPFINVVTAAAELHRGLPIEQNEQCQHVMAKIHRCLSVNKHITKETGSLWGPVPPRTRPYKLIPHSFDLESQQPPVSHSQELVLSGDLE